MQNRRFLEPMGENEGAGKVFVAGIGEFDAESKSLSTGSGFARRRAQMKGRSDFAWRRIHSAVLWMAFWWGTGPAWAVSACGADGCRAPAGVDLEAFTPQRVVQVSSLEEFERALTDALPGDRIDVADGEFETSGPLVIRRSGSRRDPIVIRSKNPGRANIAGRAGFRVESAEYVAIQGFVLSHSGESPALDRAAVTFALPATAWA